MNELSEEELEEAKGWLAGLDIHSEYEATLKEIILSTLDELEEQDKKIDALVREQDEREKYTNKLETELKAEKEKNKELLKERESFAEEYIYKNPWLYKQLNEVYMLRTEAKKELENNNKKWRAKIKAKIKELEKIQVLHSRYGEIKVLQELMKE